MVCETQKENKAAEDHKRLDFNLREIEMETGIPQASVHWITKFDLGLTPFKLSNV